jgi:hypothetical protein
MQRVTRTVEHVGLRLPIVALAVASSLGCYGTEDPVRAVLDQRLAQAPMLYHLGCNEFGMCPDPHRLCGAGVLDAMRLALAAGEDIAVEWESPEGDRGDEVPHLWYYWFIRPDGSGEYYHYEWEGEDDPVCGRAGAWCRESRGAGELYDLPTDEFLLSPYGSPLRYPEQCNWP